uniref:Methylglutaconyl-CoA hydratase, mitochondrial n=1 Tax=Rhabditophanes sp. KR3021 TaxID=114890 RepID=A0AC35U1Q9_9BILA
MLRGLLVKNLALNVRAFAATPSKGPLIVERLQDENKGIVLLKLYKPETKNAISKLLLEQLVQTLDDLKFDKDARVVILKSDVAGTFCTGADLKERKLMPVEDVPKFVDKLRKMTVSLSSLPIPVIAVIDGYALGGGLEIALSCDIRIAEAKSKLGLVETKLAIIPGAGGTQRLIRAVGVSKAKELIYTAKMIGAKEAESIGLINHCVEGDATAKAFEMAKQIIKNGPIAIKLAKIAIDEGSEVSISHGFKFEQQCYAQVIPTLDRIEGLKAFAEKRTPVYKGH